MFPENSPLDYGRPGRVLDIGCGQGALLDRLREAGWETWGIDADERAAAAVARRGHRALAGEFRRDRFGSNRFDLIWMFHSLEHMHDPLLACTDAGNLLAPGGVLMLRAPATSGILPRWRLSDWYNLDVPRHLWHFSPATLTALLARAGFHVIVLQTYSTWVDYAATVRNAWRSWRGGVGPTSSPPFGPWTAILFRLAWAAAARPLDLVGCGDRMFVVATRHS